MQYTKTMESIFTFFTLFSLLLFASTIDARKDLGEYWRGAMKGQPMPEAIQGLVGSNPISSVSNEKTNCHEHEEKKSSVRDFEPGSNATVYNNDVKPTEEKSSVKDFEPIPDVSVYHDDAALNEEKSFVKDFEPSPNLSVYHDDAALKEEKPFVDDFEPRPNLSVYSD